MNTTVTFTYNILYRILNIAAVYAIVLIISRLAGVEGYGLLSLMIVNATFFNLVSGFGADGGITYHAANGKLPAAKILTIVFIIIAAQLLILGITEIVYYHFTSRHWIFTIGHAGYWWVGFLFFVSISLTEKYTSLFNGHYLFVFYSRILFFTNLLVVMALCCFFYFSARQAIETIVETYVLLYLVQSLILMRAFHRQTNTGWKLPAVNAADIKIFLSFSAVTLLSNFIQFLCYRMDYWFIDYYRSAKELGWYAFAVRLVQAFWILPVLFAGILFTQVARKKDSFSNEAMHFFIRMLFLGNLLAGAASFLLVQWAVPFIFGAIYSASILPFRILLPGIILFCYTTILAAFFSGKGLLRINLAGSIICFVVILLADLLLIPPYGMPGAAAASCMGYTASCVFSVSVYCRQNHVPLKHLFVPRKNDWQLLRSAVQTNLLKRNR